MRLTSPAFDSNATIPTQYTCDGANVSPPLRVESIPEAAASLTLICDDPDAPAGIWSHWILYDIPADVERLPEDYDPKERGKGGVPGRNDFGDTGYGGPCPPAGPEHTYYFRLYALDTLLDIPPGATRDQILDVIQNHIIAETELQGRYGRS